MIPLLCRAAGEGGSKAKGGKKKKRRSSEMDTDEEAIAELIAEDPELGLDPAGVAAVDDARDPEVLRCAVLCCAVLCSPCCACVCRFQVSLFRG